MFSADRRGRPFISRPSTSDPFPRSILDSAPDNKIHESLWNPWDESDPGQNGLKEDKVDFGADSFGEKAPHLVSNIPNMAVPLQLDMFDHFQHPTFWNCEANCSCDHRDLLNSLRITTHEDHIHGPELLVQRLELFFASDRATLKEAFQALNDDEAGLFLDILYQVSKLQKCTTNSPPGWVQTCDRWSRRIVQNREILPRRLVFNDVIHYDETGQYVDGGGQADIYIGKAPSLDGLKVAVKVFRTFKQDEAKQLRNELYREVSHWCYLEHPYILPFLGVTTNFVGSRAGIISPWMEHGNIIQYLKKFPDANRLKLITQIAEAVRFLHSHKFIHGDLKAENVLIDQNENPRVADFGLTKLSFSKAMSSTVSTRRGGTYAYLAPELFDEQVGRTCECDTYAFAMLAYEVSSGSKPFPGMEYQVISRVMKGERPPRLEQITAPLWGVICECWSQEPGGRPKMSYVHDKLLLIPVSAVPASTTPLVTVDRIAEQITSSISLVHTKKYEQVRIEPPSDFHKRDGLVNLDHEPNSIHTQHYSSRGPSPVTSPSTITGDAAKNSHRAKEWLVHKGPFTEHSSSDEEGSAIVAAIVGNTPLLPSPGEATDPSRGVSLDELLAGSTGPLYHKVRQALPLPKEWSTEIDAESKVVYRNLATNSTSFDHPNASLFGDGRSPWTHIFVRKVVFLREQLQAQERKGMLSIIVHTSDVPRSLLTRMGALSGDDFRKETVNLKVDKQGKMKTKEGYLRELVSLTSTELRKEVTAILLSEALASTNVAVRPLDAGNPRLWGRFVGFAIRRGCLIDDGVEYSIRREIVAFAQRAAHGRTSTAISNFLDGLFEVVDRHLLSIFDETELEYLLSGLEHLDIDDWKQNTLYERCSPNDRPIQWFWQHLGQLQFGQRKRLLFCVTGTYRVPITGFRNIYWCGNLRAQTKRFTIAVVPGSAVSREITSCMIKLPSDHPTYGQFSAAMDAFRNEAPHFR